jgi:hypothetical protein
MARSKANKKAVEDTEVRAEVEENFTLAIRDHVDGTFSKTQPRPNPNFDAVSEVVSRQQPHQSAGKQD